MSYVETIKNVIQRQKEYPLTKEFSQDQRSLSDVICYCRLLDHINSAATHYSQWKTTRSNCSSNRATPEDLQTQARTALEDLYNAGNDEDKLSAFDRDWENEAEVFKNLFKTITPKMQKEKEKIEKKVSTFGIIDKFKTAVSVSKRIKDLSHEQRSILLQRAGYNEKEAMDICKKLAVSSGLTMVEYGMFLATTYTAAGVAAANPFFTDINNFTIAALVSYIPKYSSALLNSYQNIRLLKEESIKNSPNILSTSTYYFLDKFLKDKEKLRDWSSVASNIIGTLAQDVLLTPALISPIGASVITAKNMSTAGFCSIESGVKEIWLRAKKSEKG